MPNGSSIAFVAEYEGRRLLLAADAHPSDLVASLRCLNADSPSEIHLAKVSHHGSRGNTTPELVHEMRSRRFAISTSGGRHRHPDPEVVARLIHCAPGNVELFFNYRSVQTEAWGRPAMVDAYGHTCVYASDQGELSIDV